jgi:hypothetical protein
LAQQSWVVSSLAKQVAVASLAKQPTNLACMVIVIHGQPHFPRVIAADGATVVL